ncbi:dienelactone hydrolase family protein [Stigmatella sp. ncwal1]|uniref:Dienelactone hydrolase family protein n=1 Tax=Stigmatella ashevillensis TaxID=2995309 RepID=A0ABT5DJD3_9BACT|nr:dienelactone hydrolase family protein [Stigmatella ashevillena]MDC0712471.1 dienelactone hydrolase family protein [Stigmatella ashevillena]
MLRRGGWGVAALVLGACAAGQPVEVSREPSDMGAMSEQEFRALHRPRSEAAGPHQGEELVVGGARAYLRLPEGAPGPTPAVLVLHDVGGLSEHFLLWSDRLAAEGYAALAVDLYGTQEATAPDGTVTAVKTLDAARAWKVLQAAHAFLVKDERVRAPRTAVIGWGLGGSWALRLGMGEPTLDAVVSYSGLVEADPEALSHLRAPLLVLLGTKDATLPAEQQEAFVQALDEAQGLHRVLRYEAEHGFENPASGQYDARVAAAAWQAVDLFLERQLKR